MVFVVKFFKVAVGGGIDNEIIVISCYITEIKVGFHSEISGIKTGVRVGNQKLRITFGVGIRGKTLVGIVLVSKEDFVENSGVKKG